MTKDTCLRMKNICAIEINLYRYPSCKSSFRYVKVYTYLIQKGKVLICFLWNIYFIQFVMRIASIPYPKIQRNFSQLDGDQVPFYVTNDQWYRIQQDHENYYGLVVYSWSKITLNTHSATVRFFAFLYLLILF